MIVQSRLDVFVGRHNGVNILQVVEARAVRYLIERAQVQFPVRSAEGKVKAVNYLLPHIQRIPSRIVRDELARESAQKLGIDSAVLRQELKHAANTRSAAALKAPLETQGELLLSRQARAHLQGGPWQAATGLRGSAILLRAMVMKLLPALPLTVTLVGPSGWPLGTCTVSCVAVEERLPEAGRLSLIREISGWLSGVGRRLATRVAGSS